MKHVIWVFWPAFVAAGIAEGVFFAMIDPQQLYFLGEQVALSDIATYSIGFLLFWLICAGSSLMTWFMLPQEIKRSLDRLAREHAEVAETRQRRPGDYGK